MTIDSDARPLLSGDILSLIVGTIQNPMNDYNFPMKGSLFINIAFTSNRHTIMYKRFQTKKLYVSNSVIQYLFPIKKIVTFFVYLMYM